MVFTFAWCSGQTQAEIISYLKLRFPEPDTTATFKAFYDDKYYDQENLPVKYMNETLSEMLPKFDFYIFSLLYSGCYTLERRRSILIYNKETRESYIQSNIAHGIFQEGFINILNSTKAKNNKAFEKYLLNVAALLFSTNNVVSIKEVSTFKNNKSFIDQKNGNNLTFNFQKRRIEKITYK